MRKIFTLLAAILLMASGWAQSPQKMSYQAVIRDATNHLVTTVVGMKISILQGSSGGPAVFVETQTTTPNVNGIISIEIGGGTPVTGTVAGIDWAAGPYYIKTETDPLGGTAYTITGTSQLLSMPYALYTGHYIGELYGGGIVVSVWKISGVEHGLIASLTDMPGGKTTWSDVTGTLIPLNAAASPIDGQANSTAIIAQQTLTSAAQLCKDFNGGGKTDWYLPAIWELNKCYQAALIVNNVLGVNGFMFDFYWSSTEASATEAWYHGFHTNIAGSNGLKGNLGFVRAVRKF
jgi:hypothetical protein